MSRPLAIDLYAGLGGWSEALLAEGWDVVGFDIERHAYGEHRYPAQLVIQDVLTLHGSQFREAALIVASPPCQAYSYMAMPWTKAKAKAAAIRADETGQMLADLNRLFDACFRIQREACEAVGRHIPMVVENVLGAEPWVGRARGKFGSFYLWGDVPGSSTQLSLLGDSPTVERVRLRTATNKLKGGDVGWRSRGPGRQLQDHAIKVGGFTWSDYGKADYVGKGFNRSAEAALKVPGFRFDGSGRSFQSASVATKAPGLADGRFPPGGLAQGAIKNGNDWFGPGPDCSLQHRASSGSNARKAASALIAKIPEPLARHVARSFRPS